jgi:hypothetical protein
VVSDQYFGFFGSHWRELPGYKAEGGIMRHEELVQRFRCGTIDKEYENCTFFRVVMSIIFTLVGMYFFWTMLADTTLVARLDNIAVLLFCLWRIHRQRDIMCYLTEKGIIVRRQFMSLKEFTDEQLHDDKMLVFLPYSEIFVIGDDWREIQLGEPTEGGLAVLPVHLQFLSKKDKQTIIDRIKQEQEKPEK